MQWELKYDKGYPATCSASDIPTCKNSNSSVRKFIIALLTIAAEPRGEIRGGGGESCESYGDRDSFNLHFHCQLYILILIFIEEAADTGETAWISRSASVYVLSFKIADT